MIYMSSLQPRFSTGLQFLDQRLGGGISTSSVVAITAPPASQIQLFLREITTKFPLLHISTSCRDEGELESWFESVPGYRQDVIVKYIPPNSIRETLPTYLGEFPSKSMVVIDSVTPLENTARPAHIAFLNDLKEWAVANDSIVLLSCLDTVPPPPLRATTLHRADHVWVLKVQLQQSEVRNRLYITKSRPDAALEEPIPLALTDSVDIDTSRNI